MTETFKQYQPYIDRISGQVMPMSPIQFGEAYTLEYEGKSSDSTFRSRKHMIGRLIEGMKAYETSYKATGQRLKILDLGSGPQQLEKELQAHPEFMDLAEFVQIVTLDISTLSSEQLVAADIPHVRGNGAELPFADGVFDIVFSSMAIDCMPRYQTFSEIKRVMKSDGLIMANFVHPDLIDIAVDSRPIVEEKFRRARKKLIKHEQHAKDSSTYAEDHAKLLRAYEAAKTELEDIDTFHSKVLAELVFRSVDEITAFLTEQFPQGLLAVSEHTNKHDNGWFAADVDLAYRPDVYPTEEQHLESPFAETVSASRR